jgi:hypothetical protein
MSDNSVVSQERQQLIARLRQIFFPYADRRGAAVRASGERFVYYSTADVAVSILRNKEIWMRNAVAMNDFMEIAHGFDCLSAAYKSAPGAALKNVIEPIYPGIWTEVEQLFNGWLPTMRNETYLTCLSEHCVDEDENGRLSMWRAYGGTTGVAMVLNGAVMFSETNATGVFSSPVQYASTTTFASELAAVAQGMAAERDYIASLGKEAVRTALFTMLQFAMLCTKHPGFVEEREWRVIACPTLHPVSSLLRADVEVVRGTPQKVMKLKLRNAPEHRLVGLDVPQLLDRIIIGPCEFPLLIYQALVQLLTELNVPDPGTRVIVSDIPLRHIK